MMFNKVVFKYIKKFDTERNNFIFTFVFKSSSIVGNPVLNKKLINRVSSEGEKVGSRILQLQAQDRDEGQFGTITFSIGE